jgi:hypothetical protein
VSGVQTAGFVILAFPAQDFDAHGVLRCYCKSIGDAILFHRSNDATKTTAVAHRTSMAILTHDRQAALDDGVRMATDVFPAHLVGSMAARSRRRKSVDTSNPQYAPFEGTPEDLMADTYECVTCIFADVCGFTRIAGLISPEDSMHLLDRLFQRFDTLATAHNVYKGASALAAALRWRS